MKGKAKIGYKAERLLLLKENGFTVPEMMVLDTSIYDRVIEGNQNKIKDIMHQLTDTNVEEISRKIYSLFMEIEFPESILEKIKAFLSIEKSYSVRSSGILEDTEEHSFAGLYKSFLYQKNIKEIKKSIQECYASLFSMYVLKYILDYGFQDQKLKMAIIIQEMVDAEYSGVAFTVNPITGMDSEMLIEVTQGVGEKLVSGKRIPYQLIYNWKREERKGKYFQTLITQNILDTFLEIQKFFGYPCDIEFAIKKKQLFILQARPITKIQYQGIEQVWTNANFRDGGVAAEVCTSFMTSLYQYTFTSAIKKFVIDSKILSKRECKTPICEMFYGRPYWNLSFIKKVMSRVIGYKEKDFDATYGIHMNYQGEGECTKITPISLFRMIYIGMAQNHIIKETLKNVKYNKKYFLKQYREYIKKAKDSSYKKREDLETLWKKLIIEDYFKVESNYFRQVAINTVQQAIHKESLIKYMSEREYLELMSGIQNISHLRPAYRLWQIGENIREDKQAYIYWSTHTPEEILKEIKGRKENLLLKKFIKDFGYHSERELNLTYPCFIEDLLLVIKMFQRNILSENIHSPFLEQKNQRKCFERKLRELETSLSKREYRRLKKKIHYMRYLLWWREEFKDISTRFYYIIRLYTLKLAKIYMQEGVIESQDDIWMLRIADIFSYIQKEISSQELRRRIKKNRDYYLSFYHDKIREELGRDILKISDRVSLSRGRLKGLGCHAGVVKGRARVIQDIREIDTLQKNDILVAKYTDTGWASKFASLSGMITEYGGVLCHAAIIAREYGIPCIVAVPKAMQKIQDGDFIIMNGESGEIHIVEK